MQPMRPMTPMTPAPAWWPDHLGQPSTTGAQNDVRYAFFANKRRLVVQHDGQLDIYNSADHAISGVSQRQGEAGSLVFVSQHGTMDLAKLERAG